MIQLVLGLVVGVLLDGAELLLAAWVATKLWTWYAVATFAAPAISVPVAAGLIAIVWVAAPYRVSKDDTKIPAELIDALSEELSQKMISALRLLVILTLGWAVKTWWLP